MKRLMLSLAVLAFSTAAYADPRSPQQLGELWVKAIQAHSTDQLQPLIHPGCKNGVIKPAILNRMVAGDVAPRYTFSTSEIGPREALEKIFLVIPEKNLLLTYDVTTPEEKKQYGMGKGFPIARADDGSWYFAICAKQ